MAFSIPLQWKLKGHAIVWQPVDELVYKDIVDGALVNKWEILSLPVAPNSLEVRYENSSHLLWRERDPLNAIVRGGSFPPWMLVSVSWAL
jgi:hypothetical protein